MPKTPGMVRRNLLIFKIRLVMKRNLIPYMPADQVRLCNSNNDCIEARGDNARFIVLAIATVLFAAAAYYLFKIK